MEWMRNMLPKGHDESSTTSLLNKRKLVRFARVKFYQIVQKNPHLFEKKKKCKIDNSIRKKHKKTTPQYISYEYFMRLEISTVYSELRDTLHDSSLFINLF